MREQRNISNMTDRELRAYKRELRRRIARRRRLLSIVATICLIAACVISYRSLTTNASGIEEVSFKYYTGITVESKDTLWSIADRYMDERQYASKREYIAEVCSINHMEDEDDLVAGRRIVVPYYSAEYIR